VKKAGFMTVADFGKTDDVLILGAMVGVPTSGRTWSVGA